MLKYEIEDDGHPSNEQEVSSGRQRRQVVQVSDLVERENDQAGDQHPDSDIQVYLPMEFYNLQQF